MKTNWFIGLPVPAGAWFNERIVDVPAGVRRFHPLDLHITVAFLGSVDASTAAGAWDHFSIWSSGPINITLGRVVPMGNPRRASALSALLSEGCDEISSDISRCQNIFLQAAGRPPSRRKPKPHLTIGRIHRRARGLERSLALEWAAGLDVGGVGIRITELALFSWSLERHERLFRIGDSCRL